VPVSVAEKDREFVPVGVKADVTKGTEDHSAEAKPEEKSAPGTSEPAKGTVNVSSDPAGAHVSLNHNFIGNSPATLKLAPGKHIITVKMAGYQDWTREITLQSGSEVQLTATLEKAQ